MGKLGWILGHWLCLWVLLGRGHALNGADSGTLGDVVSESQNNSDQFRKDAYLKCKNRVLSGMNVGRSDVVHFRVWWNNAKNVWQGICGRPNKEISETFGQKNSPRPCPNCHSIKIINNFPIPAEWMGPPKGLVGDGKIPQPGHLAGIKKIRRRNNLEPKHQIVDQSYNKSKKSKKGGAKKGGAKKPKTSKVHKGAECGAKKSKTAKVHKEKVCKGKTCPKGKKVGSKAKIPK
jgi:hypothetical protein